MTPVYPGTTPPSHSLARVGRSLLLLLVLLSLTGCLSNRYKSAPKKTPPPAMLNLGGEAPPLGAVIHTVIYFHGPGSWKRDAYWDEYVVTFANSGSVPLRVDSATLVDITGVPAQPGVNPWAIEKLSRTDAQRVSAALGTSFKIGASTIGVMTVGALPAFAGMGGAAVSPALVAAGALVAPVFLVGTIFRNVDHRHDIEKEFAHRRLVLPATVAPGALAQGSLFFRVSPGPRHLTLRYTVEGGAERSVSLMLGPLAGLHLTGPTPARPPRRQ